MGKLIYFILQGSCAARLDLLERKVDSQNQEIGNLRTEHEELKTMFKVLKKTRDTFIIDEHNLKNNAEATKEAKDLGTPNIDTKHRFILKKPARLLPLSLFQKYAISSFTNHM